MSDCPECDFEQRTGQAAPVTHTCLKREHRPRKHLYEESPGDQELRVSYDVGEVAPSMSRPPVILIEGTPHALTLVQHLISQALSMTTEGNTVSAIHQKTGAKIIVRRTDL